MLLFPPPPAAGFGQDVHLPRAEKGSRQQREPQLIEKLLFGEKAFRFTAGGVRGGGSPLVLNRMAAKSLRQQPVAPRSGSFLDCEADKKRGIVKAVEKV